MDCLEFRVYAVVGRLKAELQTAQPFCKLSSPTISG